MVNACAAVWCFGCGLFCACNGNKCAGYGDDPGTVVCMGLAILCAGMGVWNLCQLL